MFGDIIRSFRKQNGLSQTSFVNALQKSSENFNSLDVVTLSRWERGATKPHLTRQNEILELMGIDIFDTWVNTEKETKLPDFTKKLTNNGYFDFCERSSISVTTLNVDNLHLIKEYESIIDTIFEYEKSIILVNMEKTGLSRAAIIEKIIVNFKGELTIVTVHEQLLGHIFFADYSLFIDVIDDREECDPNDVYFVLSFNCCHQVSLTETIGREVYKYLQALNPSRKFVIFTSKPKIVDLLFSLGFDYKTVKYKDISYKSSEINFKALKSQKVWMNIITNYKGEKNE